MPNENIDKDGYFEGYDELGRRRACIMCNGSGKDPRNSKTCGSCGGKGWTRQEEKELCEEGPPPLPEDPGDTPPGQPGPRYKIEREVK